MRKACSVEFDRLARVECFDAAALRERLRGKRAMPDKSPE